MGQMLFEPFQIKGMRLKNRLGLAPLLNMPQGPDGLCDEKTVRWFEDRAKGGVGLIMTGAFSPLPTQLPGQGIGMHSNECIAPFAKVVEAVHKHGAKIGVQLAAGGVMTGTPPSPGPYPDAEHPTETFLQHAHGIPAFEGVPPTVEQLAAIEDAFAAAAARVKAAGADCVELHCAHGGATLHCSFISPYYNKRTDEYGGSWEGRLRLPVRTLRKMRQAVGDDFPIFARLSADQLVGDRGITLEDTLTHIVPALDEAGVDCFDVSQGDILRAPEGILITMYYSRGCFIHLAEAVKKVTSKPVIGVGRIVDLDMAEAFLEEGKADLIYMGRQLTADPETPNKYQAGHKDEIRLCLGCNEGCGTPCAVNYDISPEAKPLLPAEQAKRVLVIGGGVGGMEAARVCALRGHEVTLMEKSAELGGMVAALARTPSTCELGNIVKYLGVQMEKLGIDVRVCKTATGSDVAKLEPDAVIVATGSELEIPEVARNNPRAMTHISALHRTTEIGQRVVIWGLVATDLAISLAEQGKDVVLLGRGGIETLDKYCSANRRWHALRKLTDIPVARASAEAVRVANPEVLYHVQVEAVTHDEVQVVSQEGRRRSLPYDTLIISLHRSPDESLFADLEGKVPDVYRVGDQLLMQPDAANSANIKGAIWSANEVARQI